ncbi:MAG: Ni/Fe hydrogenase subunit alpha [Desulfovibrio sp.]
MAKASPAKKEEQKQQEESGKKVNVHYLTRVEGHGNIVVEIQADGTVTKCSWEVPEAPRFFEAMVLGRDYRDVHHITSRICGICSIGHQIASLQGTEDALNIRVSDQSVVLRKLALHAENLQSHLLHIVYLVLPDLMGVDSIIPLAQTNKEDVLKLIEARKISNEFSRIICGRTTHPQRMTPGGWVKLPTNAELKELRAMLKKSLTNLDFLVDVYASLEDKVPQFERETEYISLVSPAEYALYWGEIGSTQDSRHPARHYKNITREYCVPQSTAKWAKNKGKSFMVGALARYNLNEDKLSAGARKAAQKLNLKPMCTNPFMNTHAQIVECVHTVEDSIKLIDSILKKGIKQETLPEITARAGRGTGAVEVPRGILYHSYEYDDNGRVFAADCVIPTNQNHANIQLDMEALVPTLTGKSEAEIELILSMLVRAYDPCISCSTHVINLYDRSPEGKFVQFHYKD